MNKIMKTDDPSLFDDVERMNNQLTKESDLGVALIATSFVDACLESLLRAHLKNSRVTTKLLNPTSGILGTFSSKCDITYCLSLIGKETYNDLIKLGEIRNIFAHNHLEASFNNEKVRDSCNKLQFFKYYLEDHHEQSNFAELKVFFENPKNQFIYTARNVSNLLMKQRISIKFRDRKGSNST